jgi:uncharacterized membrane protein (DUF485 family)
VTLVGGTEGRAQGRHGHGVGEPALFGGAPEQQRPTGPDYRAIQSDPGFRALRRRHRSFVFPLAALFMLWYLTFVLLAAYAHGFMSRPVLGAINVGMLMGVAQFVSTLVVMAVYCRYATKRLDPAAAEVRDRVEGW